MALADPIKFIKSLFKKKEPAPTPEIKFTSPSIMGGVVITPPAPPPTTPTTPGGGGGGKAPVPTTPPPAIIYDTTPTTFTGKVEEFTEGVKQKETFYVTGKETGAIVYDPALVGAIGGYSVYDVSPSRAYAETTTPSTFLFDRPSGVREEYVFGEGGAEITIGPIPDLMINIKTGLPYGIYEEAKVGFKYFKPELPLLRRSLEYAGAKVESALYSKYSPFTVGEARSVAKLKPIAEVGSFFIPVVGPSLLVGLGAETIISPKGRAMVSATSLQIEEKYGVPAPVVSVGQYGLAVTGMVVGGKALIGDIEKILKLPTTQTRLLGASQELREGRIVTDVYFETKTTRLLGKETSIGFVRGTSEVLKTTEAGLQTGKIHTMGVVGTKGVKFPSAELKVGQIRQFDVMGGVVSKPAEITKAITLDTGITLSKQFEGTQQFFFGRGAVGKDIFGRTGVIFPTGKLVEVAPKLKKFEFVGAGGAIEYEKGFEIFGRTGLIKEGEILRRGKGIFEGFIVRKAPAIDTGITILKPSTITRTPLSKTFAEQIQTSKLVSLPEVQKVMQQSTAAVSQAKIITPTRLPGLMLQERKEIQALPSQQMQRVVQTQQFAFAPLQMPAQALRYAGATRERELLRTLQIPKFADVQAVRLASLLGTRQLKVQRQTLKQISPTTYFPIIPIIPPRGIIPLLPPISDLGLGRPRLKGARARRGYEYTPSLGAVLFRLKAPKIPTGVELTGFLPRPIITGRKASKKRKKK